LNHFASRYLVGHGIGQKLYYVAHGFSVCLKSNDVEEQQRQHNDERDCLWR